MRLGTCLIVALCGCAAGSAANPVPFSLEDLQRQAAAIRPTAQESRWLTIPWLSSAVEAERVALQEKRPILYWNVADDPLDRC